MSVCMCLFVYLFEYQTLIMKILFIAMLKERDDDDDGAVRVYVREN